MYSWFMTFKIFRIFVWADVWLRGVNRIQTVLDFFIYFQGPLAL